MRWFATVVTFASIAFAAIASALPTGAGSVVESPGNAPDAVTRSADLKILHTGVGLDGQSDSASARTKRSETGFEEFAVAAALSARDESSRGIPDVITELNDKILPLCHDLNGKVMDAPSADVALSGAMEVLGEIKDLLTTAKGEIESLIANPIEVVFCLNGKLLDAHAIAQIVAVLTVSVSTALGFVIKACASVQTDALVELVNEIAGLLADILGLALKVVANLLVDLKPLLHCVVDIILDLNLTALVNVLQLAMKA